MVRTLYCNELLLLPIARGTLHKMQYLESLRPLVSLLLHLGVTARGRWTVVPRPQHLLCKSTIETIAHTHCGHNSFVFHSQALKMYMRARDHCTSAKHIVQLCLNIIKVRFSLTCTYTSALLILLGRAEASPTHVVNLCA